MGKSTPQAPSAIDPVQTSRAQSAANKDTAVAQANLNMVNQYTPFGSLEYSQRGTASDGTPQYAATQTLTPQQQRIADLSQNASEGYGQVGNNLLNAAKGTLEQPFDMTQFGAAPTYDANFRDQQKQALLTRSQSQWDQQRDALQTRLANQGLTAGTQAYDNAYQAEYAKPYNDFLLGADINAGNLADTEYSRMLRSRQNSISEALMPRQQTINELASWTNGTQLQTPSYVNTPQTGIQGTDIIGAQGLAMQGQQNAYNQAMGSNNAMRGGLFGLGGAALGGSLAGGYWG